SSLGSDTDRLVKVDAANGKELAVLASNPKSDVDDVMVQPDTHVVQAASFDYLKREWTVIDPSIEEDFNAISKIQRGIFTIVSRDRADKNWIVAYQRDDGPVAWYVYHRDSRKVDFLFSNRPELEKYRLASLTLSKHGTASNW
ncbi:MAG: S9 family peptidase, partial [Syntrophorhabdales bacterium]